MANELFASNRPIFTTGIGVVAAVDPYSHVYTLTPYPTLQAVPPIPAITLGARGNTRRGVQLQTGYYIGDMVLYIQQTNYGSNAVTNLAYIVGSITTDFIAVNSPEDMVKGSRWDDNNLDADSISLFHDLLTRNQINVNAPWATGHGGVDMPVGAYEAAGKLVSLLLDDYFAGFRATCAELLVSGIDRRLISRSMLRTVSTVNSVEDIAILNTSTITTKKSCGNVQDAWYACVEESDNEITAVESSDSTEQPSPIYRDITQSGDVLYGTHRTIFDQKEEIPLYTDFLGMDGTRKMLSTSRVIIGKRPGLKAVQFIGKRLGVDDQSETKQDTGDIDYPVQLEASDNWRVTEDAMLFAMNGYPASFVDAALGEYEDDEDTFNVEDKARADGGFPIKAGGCHIEFQDDGGIKLVDAWGSFILLSHGNVEIHAVNNIITTAARDTLMFSGHNQTLYTTQDISLQAYKGVLRIDGGKDLLLHAGSEDTQGRIVIDSAQDLKILATAVSVDSLDVLINCRDPKNPNNGNGTFQVLAKDGKINFSGAFIRHNAKGISLTSDTKALIVGATITVAGDVMLHGGIRSWRKNTRADIVDMFGRNSTKTFSAGTQGMWINETGGLKLANNCYIDGQCIASSAIVGEYILTLQTQKELQRASNAGSLRIATRPLTGTKPNTDFTVGGATDLVADTPEQLQKLYFTFGTTEIGCTYRVVAPSPAGPKTWQNDGLKNRKGDVSYIYPGVKFWTGNSVIDVSVRGKEQIYPFNNLHIAGIK